MQSDTARSYLFYGCRMRSALPLCFVPEIEDTGAPPDISVVAGEVAPVSSEAVLSTPFVSVTADGAVTVQLEAVGRFLVTGGNRVVVQAEPEAEPAEIETFLMGPVAGILLHQRGVLPLHASSVEIGGRVLVLSGSAGRGKSTLAGALVRRDAVLMGDDICAVRFSDGEAPEALRGSTGLRLWPDTREAMGCGGAEWSPIRPGHAKHVGPVNGDLRPPTRRSLGAVIRIAPSNLPEPEIRRLRGPAAAAPLKDLVYRLRIGRALGREEAIFRGAMRLADQVPFFELRRPQGFGHLERTADLLLAALEGCA